MTVETRSGFTEMSAEDTLAMMGKLIDAAARLKEDLRVEKFISSENSSIADGWKRLYEEALAPPETPHWYVNVYNAWSR